MEVCVKIDKDTHDQHMKAEIEAWIKERKENPILDPDIKTHFDGMKTMGSWLMEIYEREANKRAKFFENKNHIRFIESFFSFVQKRAADLGYHYKDVVLMDTSITDSGYILLRVIPRPGAQKMGVETDG
jgi:hypothetical protein